MSIKLSDSIRVGQQKPLEDKYFNELVPYTSTTQVNTLLPKAIRHRGLTVNINGEEYWYKDGIEDNNLVLKVPNIDTFILKNQEQDSRLENLEGINYNWSPTNRTLTLFNGEGEQLSQVSLVSLDNEGTDLRYNASTLSLELYNADNELLDSIPVSSFISSVGTQLQLNLNYLELKDSQGNILSTVGFFINSIKGLQTALDNKENSSNKQNDLSVDVTNTKYPTVTAVNGGLATKLDKGAYTGNASDLKSLIDTKADLVDGKVPKYQSQPSTMVMDNPTYVITFTDATGAVQTIDLPLESLFQDANYNSSTKSLIVTLQNGTTRTIPLTDLVDLPEIVMSTSNPAVTPTTGQKVYFNTALAKVWFNVGGAWVFAGNLISDSEKTNLTNAYNHSQTTGNAHGTKVEELSDVSGTDTTIVDTDVILKKDTGGLWKKITFANFKNWFTTELAKKINIGLDTIFNFKNISAMPLSQFRSITPNIETIYFTEEQNSTGWQQIRYNGLGITIPATTETLIALTNENFIELDSDSTFNLIDVTNTKINGIFEKDFVIIKFNAGVVTPATTNQWFKVILKINNVQTAVSPVFYLTESSGTVEQIAHNFALNVPAEMVANGATLHLKTSAAMTFNNPAISVLRVHKSTAANL